MKLSKSYPFVDEKPSAALVVIRVQNKKVDTGINRNTERPIVSFVAQEIDTTYAHACKLISTLEDQGYVTSKKKGRKKYLELTEEGRNKADLLDQLCEFTESTEGSLA